MKLSSGKRALNCCRSSKPNTSIDVDKSPSNESFFLMLSRSSKRLSKSGGLEVGVGGRTLFLVGLLVNTSGVVVSSGENLESRLEWGFCCD